MSVYQNNIKKSNNCWKLCKWLTFVDCNKRNTDKLYKDNVPMCKKGTIHLTLIYNVHVVIVYPRTLKKKSYHTYQRRYFKKSAQKFHLGTKIRTWIYLGLTDRGSFLKLCFIVRLMVIFVNYVNKRNDTLVYFEKKIHTEDRSFQVPFKSFFCMIIMLQIMLLCI